MEAQLQLDGPEELKVASRSRLYALLSRAFRFPQPAEFQKIKAGEFAAAAEEALKQLPFNSLQAGRLGRGIASSYEAFEGHYIALFEIGGEHGAPSPLYEGEYGGGRMKVMEEVLRFYHFFGLHLSDEKRDRPDHLASELEFMHALSFKETEAVLEGKDRRPYRDAQRDFLRFHLSEFIGAVANKVSGNQAPFYPEAARLAANFCAKDLGHLSS
jgi:DMSO reductase family type II enzyme chaperone